MKKNTETKVIEEGIPGFDWDSIDGKTNSHNRSIKAKPGVKVYSREPYAQEVYNYLENTQAFKEDSMSKDLKSGSFYKCVVESEVDGGIIATTISGQSVFVDVNKEVKDMKRLGIEGIRFDPGSEITLVARKVNSDYYGSAVDYFIHSLRVELFDAIRNENTAYTAKIESVNKGGYIVDISGVKCFLPGSLAAANKITDFESLVGKEIYVMIESYIENKDMFVVSYKKYLEKIMENKIQDLDLTKKYTGFVTGTSKFGVFVEWEDIYTGLIHKTELEENVDLRSFKPGDEVEFYIKEVKDNNRLTLTFSEPLEKTVRIYRIQEQLETSQEVELVQEAKIKHRRKNGSLIEIPEIGSMGFIPQEKYNKKMRGLKSGDTLQVCIYEVDPIAGKIFAKPTDE